MSDGSNVAQSPFAGPPSLSLEEHSSRREPPLAKYFCTKCFPWPAASLRCAVAVTRSRLPCCYLSVAAQSALSFLQQKILSGAMPVRASAPEKLGSRGPPGNGCQACCFSHIACRITASLRATATIALRLPRFVPLGAARLKPQRRSALSGPNGLKMRCTAPAAVAETRCDIPTGLERATVLISPDQVQAERPPNRCPPRPEQTLSGWAR